jgi:AcrR family transcriptional regulator
MWIGRPTVEAASTTSQAPPRARRRNPRGQGERLRDELIEAAAALLVETRDASKLSLRGVASRVGVAATSVYLHFPDVEHLKVAVVERGHAALEQARNAASAGVADPVQALLARCRAYCQFALDHPGHYRLMFGPDLPAALAYGADDGGPAPGRNALQGLAHSIQRCQQAGAARALDDPLSLAVLVWTALHGLVSLRIDRPSFPWPASLDEMADQAVRRLLVLDPSRPLRPSGDS